MLGGGWGFCDRQAGGSGERQPDTEAAKDEKRQIYLEKDAGGREKREAPGIRSGARGTPRDDGEKEGMTTSDSSDTDRPTMGETEAKKPECKASVERVCVQGRRRDTASVERVCVSGQGLSTLLGTEQFGQHFTFDGKLRGGGAGVLQLRERVSSSCYHSRESVITCVGCACM